jgi:AcrR family transcriptional regulator
MDHHASSEHRAERTALLEAGRRLAQREVLDQPVPAVIASEAGVSEGLFHACFRDSREYLLALHQHFLREILKQVIVSLSGLPPGVKRLQTGVQAFLDGCLQLQGLRALLLRMESNPDMTEEARRRRRAFMEMLRLEFKAAGWAHPEETARLYRVMVEEAALTELEAGRELPVVRHILWQFLRGDAW